MEKLENLVRRSIENILETKKSFDTHELIIKLAHENQREYIALLYKKGGTKPFQALHSDIGRIIKSLIGEFGLSESDSKSRDIFLHENTCSRWSRS